MMSGFSAASSLEKLRRKGGTVDDVGGAGGGGGGIGISVEVGAGGAGVSEEDTDEEAGGASCLFGILAAGTPLTSKAAVMPPKT